MNPKVHATLHLIKQILKNKEQVVVFSAFLDPLDNLAARLNEAGVRNCLMDGRSSPVKRAGISTRFKAFEFPVLLCGVDSCCQGHSWPQANNVILISFSWAADAFIQSLSRIYRINSPKPVNLFSIVCDGSIDRKLEAMIHEKGDASELVLDGHLLGEHTQEVNLAELLQVAQREFKQSTQAQIPKYPNTQLGSLGTCSPLGISYVDEVELEKSWPPLRRQLAEAMRDWDELELSPCGVMAATPQGETINHQLSTNSDDWQDLLWARLTEGQD